MLPQSWLSKAGRAHSSRIAGACHHMSVCWAILFVACSCSPAISQSEVSDVLAEIEAGSDANLALITSGILKYSVETKWRGPKKPPLIDRMTDPKLRKAIESTYQPERDLTVIMDVWWDGLQLRLDLTEPPEQIERTIVGSHDAVVFKAPWMGTDRQFQAVDYVARIQPISKVSSPLAHPLNQGVPMYSHSDRLTLSTYLRAAKTRSLKIDVARKDGLVELVIDDSERFSRREFIIDPAQGYNVVTYRNWSTKLSDVEPDTVIKTTYSEGPPGAFHMSRTNHVSHQLLDGPGQNKPPATIATELDCELVSADFSAPPDEALFTIDSLGLPVGARIEDTIQGKTYHYGVDAPASATLDNIEWTASGAHPSANWWRWLVSATVLTTVILAIASLYFRSRRRA